VKLTEFRLFIKTTDSTKQRCILWTV